MEKWQLIMNELEDITDILKDLNDKPMAIDKKVKTSQIYNFDDPYPEMVQEYLATRTHEQLYNLLLEIMTGCQIDDLIDRIEEEKNETK